MVDAAFCSLWFKRVTAQSLRVLRLWGKGRAAEDGGGRIPLLPVELLKLSPHLTSHHFSKFPLPASSAPASVPQWPSRAQFQLLRREKAAVSKLSPGNYQAQTLFHNRSALGTANSISLPVTRMTSDTGRALSHRFHSQLIAVVFLSARLETWEPRNKLKLAGALWPLYFTRGNKQIWKSCLISPGVS